MTRPAVFLDRDGTIIADKGHLADPAGVEILPTVVEALRLLREHGFATVIVSNQSGVARGYFDDETVRVVNAEIARQLAGDGVSIDGWYWCPHFDDGCSCRKPEPGLVHRAIELLCVAHDAQPRLACRASYCPGRIRTLGRSRTIVRARCWMPRSGSWAAPFAKLRALQ